MPQALVGQSLEAGVLLARRFGNLTALPEHPLFPAIHGRLIAGEGPYRLARWIQGRVPIDDPLGTASMQPRSLEQKLRRYKALMPRHMLAPVTPWGSRTHIHDCPHPRMRRCCSSSA